VQILRAAGHFAVRDGEPNQYREHLRVPDLSVGTYCVPVGGKDGQEPHTEDEVYVVTSGRAQFTSSGETIDVTAGSVFFVAAHEVHRFHDITEDLAVLVFFGPAEGSRAQRTRS
jgi:mannose-6-phosphate isomerase-like protein (cupin superfamily)